MPATGPGGSQYNSGNAKVGSQNAYPVHECTWWANERYHQLTGDYVSWAADAHGWLAGAQAAGWEWSALPPDVPSIIVLQPGVQLADGTYGHVGVVEHVNADGTVTTSDLNWGPTPAARANVSTVVFHTGPGVDFIWVGGASQISTGGPSINTGAIVSAAQTAASKLAPDASVAQVLVALDTALFASGIPNPLDTSNDNIDQWSIAGVSMDNPFSWLTAVAGNFMQETIALVIRGLFMFAGAAILIKVGSAFINYQAIGETAASGAESIRKLAAVLA